ncbi:MAG: Sapep family Mn(2+)-dependent dipeptidase [Bacillota bacterium]|jgi:succinyl-diaminopimelate desuccinylase
MEKTFDKFIENHKTDIENALLELVALESVEAPPTDKSPFGEQIGEALTKITALGRKLGFACQNHNGYYTTIDLGEVNSPQQAVGILCHADVVPLGEGWNHNPLGEIAGSRIYGRGTLDDKGPAVASLYAMAAVKNSGLPLSRPVRLVVGGNEETQSLCMKKYNEENLPLWGGFSPDGDFPVIFAEKGIAMHQADFKLESPLIKSITAGTAVNAVPGKATAVLNTDDITFFEKISKNHPHSEKIHIEQTADRNIKITAIGKSAHGSTPEKGENAAKLLLEFLNKLQTKDKLLDTLQNIYNLFFPDFYGIAAGIAVSDEVSGNLTLNPGILNYENNCLHLELDMRYPVTADYREIKEKLDKHLTEAGLYLECVEHKAPLYVDKNSPLVKTLAEIYRQTGRQDTEPLAIGGGTYCRTMDNFVAFGPVGIDDADTMHQADEYIEREHLLFLAKIYAQAIYQLAK